MHYKAIAEYYDAENEQHAMLQRDVPFFLGHLPRNRRLKILDLCCGTGRAAIPVAQAGHRVVGVDYAQDMLDIAERKREFVGLDARELPLVRQDALKLNLRQRFDWICIFFNTFLNFTTLKQQDALLGAIHRHLVPRGRLWLDMFHPDHARLSGAPRQKIDPSVFYVPALDRTVYRDVDVRPEPSRQLQHLTFTYRWFTETGVARAAKLNFDLTWIVPREMQLLLERNGFKMQAMYGDYDGSALRDESNRMITIARKT